jgi:DNA-binding XRE family transcriptional regulator
MHKCLVIQKYELFLHYAQMFGLFFIFIQNYLVMEPKKSPIPKEIAPEHKKLMTEIGSGLKKLRTDSNKGLVEMAKSVKISRNEYSQLEKGQIYFKFSTLMRILDYHDKSFKDFANEL